MQRRYTTCQFVRSLLANASFVFKIQMLKNFIEFSNFEICGNRFKYGEMNQ